MRFTKNMLFSTLLAMCSASAMASEMNAGVVHFTGEIIEPSCEISGDDGRDSTVPLGTYPTSLFAKTGDESPEVPFSIALVNCPVTTDGLPMVQLTFNAPTTLTGTPTLMDVSKLTTTGETAATGVGIAVSLDGKTELLKFDGSEGQVYVPLSTMPDDTLTTNFNARYISFTDKVTAGPADGDMTVNILYR